MRSGDAFLSLMGKKLHVRLTYEKYVGFLSCFILKFIELDEPVFRLKDFDIGLGSKKAYIEPGFGKLVSEKAITMNCHLRDASFLGADIRGDLAGVFDRICGNAYDSVYAELIIYNDRVIFPIFTAYGKDVKLYASGVMAKKGDLKLTLKAFFSPRLTRQFPAELGEILTEESGGWLSYSLRAESSKDKLFLKLESDRLKLDFKKVEIK